MTAFKANSGKSTQESLRKIKVHKRYDFARTNQSSNHVIDRGANGGRAASDMRILEKT